MSLHETTGCFVTPLTILMMNVVEQNGATSHTVGKSMFKFTVELCCTVVIVMFHSFSVSPPLY